MGNNSTGIFLFPKPFRLIWILMLLLKVCSVPAQKFDESQMKQWVSSFKQELDSHIDKVLAYDQIQDMLGKFETNLVHGPINGQDIFNEIFQNVSLRYNDVVLAANTLKRALEKDVGILNFVDSTGAPSPGGGPPQLLLTKCCCGSAPGIFDGRLRDRVQPKECYGSQDSLLDSLSKTGFVNTLKENYKISRGVTWQYFADSAGHYVQYPTNKRACDRTAPPLLGSCNKLESPLTKKWYVEKLHMEHKNIVILMDNSMKRDPSAPPVAESMITEAVVKILDTLTPSDKVNIVAFPSNTPEAFEVPAKCRDGLFMASQANLINLKVFTRQLSSRAGEPNLMGGLEKVYSLLEAAKNENPDDFKKRTNLVLVLLHGQSKPFPQEETTVLEMMAQHQRKLDNTAQHFIYTLGKPADNATLGRLAEVADQNNLKLASSSGIKVQPWPQIPNLVTNQSVGPEGVLVAVDNGVDFVTTVERYFQRLPPQADKELTTMVPILDKKYGLGLTVAVPVYNGNQPFGVVAVDGSLATIFSEIVNYRTGINSYMYVVDSTHGHVLLHPKLRDPAETKYENTIFPRLDVLEPDLSADQRKKILSAGTKNISFLVQVKDIHPEIDGELVSSRLFRLSQATLYCQQIAGTSLVVVLVHYKSDDEEPKFHSLNQLSLHGIYHRLDILFGSPDFPGKDSICHLHNGHFLSFKQSVIKFAPSIFSDPEMYKYSDESLNTVTKLNRFLSNGISVDLINPGLKELVVHTLAATDELDSLWTSSAKQVIERFYGSTNGVFRMYPGSPLVNTFDHRETDWYKRSIAFPNTTMYHYGKLSVRNSNNVIIVSRAVGSKRLQGVVGMTVTLRFLRSQLLNTVQECTGNDQECHIVDSTGRVFDATNPGLEGHLTKMYPWITEELATRGKIKQEWCTGFSDGFHKMTLTLTEDLTLSSGDPCEQFSLHKVKDTNLFVLVLGNRQKLKCLESSYKKCSSCQTSGTNLVYHLSIPKCEYCHVNETVTRCQCQCYCDTDLDTCHGQFNIQLQNFPTRSCFYSPTYSTEFKPDAPGPSDDIDRCPIPCVAIEDLDICNGLEHCKVSSAVYPTCIWKDEDELKLVNVSKFFPTTTPPRPPMPSSTDGPKPPVTTVLGPGSPPAKLTSKKSPVSLPSAPHSPPQNPPTASTRKSTTSKKTSPGFVITTNTSPVAPVMTGSLVHPVTGSSQHAVTGSSLLPVTGSSVKPTGSAIVTGYSTSVSKIIKLVTTEPTKNPLGNSSANEDKGLSGGAIAALVIGLLALIAIVVFISVKMYHKKFRTGADESSKYRTGSSMFDSTVFLRNLDQVSINASAPNSTNVPYQEMGN